MTAVRGMMLLAMLGLVGCEMSHYAYPDQFSAASQVCKNNDGVFRFSTWETNDEKPTTSINVLCRNGAYFYKVPTIQEARHDER